MTLGQVDYIFPFFVFFYGLIVTFVLETPLLQKVALQRNLPVFRSLASHRGLAFFCVIIGGLWSLQNLWF